MKKLDCASSAESSLKTLISALVLQLVTFSMAAVAQDQEEVGFVVTAVYSQQLGRSVFQIDSVTAPSIAFEKGTTYVFDLSSPTLLQHPFELSDSFDGTHSGGKPYTASVVTAGQPGTYGAYAAFTPHSDTAPNIFYFCTNHALMGGSAFPTVTGDVAPLFASSYNPFEQALTVPRVFVNTTPPQVYSLALKSNEGDGRFDIIEASEGTVSQFAFPDTLQSLFDISTNELTVKRVGFSGSTYNVQMVLAGSQLLVKNAVQLDEAERVSSTVSAEVSNSSGASNLDGPYGY
ncbi:MAG: hypothetical protein CMQ45_08880 [Gammaproteobacteria bacterium]|nr:hypothetical protein [Gammaproteobacteria bacterium]